MNSENTVAKILKVYAILNFLVCIIVCGVIADGLGWIVFALGLALSVCVNFVVYACGELLQLLHDIKLNTSKAAAAASAPSAPSAPAHIIPDELPEL